MRRIPLALCLFAAACAGAGRRSEPVFPAGSAVLFGLPYGAIPADDLITGGQPQATTFLGAARAGVKSVVDLRGLGETPHPGLERQWVKKSGMEFYHLPIPDGEAVNRENAEKLDRILSRAEKPILLHCASSNRVGALLALRAFYIGGLPAEEAVAFGKKAGLSRLERQVRRQLVEGALEKK